MTEKRDRALRDLAADVRELTSEVRLSAPFARDRQGRRDPERGIYRTRHAGLLGQLVESLVPGATMHEPGGGKPGSRTPSADAASSALFDIAHGWTVNRGRDRKPGVRSLRLRLRAEAGQSKLVAVGKPTIVASLQEIRALAHVVGEEHVQEAAQATRSFVQRARVALAYDAPIVALRDVSCPECGGELRVASDVSTDVWCANRECRDEDGRGRSWPRRNWVFLLEQLGSPG